MDELIILEAEGRASPQELDELLRWRRASEENERRYQEVRQIWTLFGLRHEVDSTLVAPSFADIQQLGEERLEQRRSDRPWWALRIAAAAAVVLVGLGVVLSQWTKIRIGTDELTRAEFRTGPNELTTAVLRDGTVARLAPNTTLEARISGETREVQLEGRAFFAAARDPNRPLVVRTADGEARVLGTRFEVDTGRNGMRLLVVDGTVALSGAGQEIRLRAGDLGETAVDSPPSVTQVEVPEALLDWMGPWVAFESTPLRRVVRELEVRLGIEVEIVDPSLADRTVTGWFSEDDRDQMLSMICRVAELTCSTVDGVVLIEE